MQYLSNFVSYINNLPPTKKLILLIILFIAVIVIIDLVSSYMKQNFKNITNRSVEKMESESDLTLSPSLSSLAPSEAGSNLLPFGDIVINTDLLNITLFYADWCGHCKKFMNESWGQLKDKFENNPNVQLNQIDCTNIKTAITTPAGKNVEGFPTLILNYKDENGKYIEEEYNGPRSYQVLSSIIDKFTGSSTPTDSKK
jgi:thiol-disulfide isomerase/thioredoxin